MLSKKIIENCDNNLRRKIILHAYTYWKKNKYDLGSFKNHIKKPLSSLFVWNDTKEGVRYWSNVCNKLYN